MKNKFIKSTGYSHKMNIKLKIYVQYYVEAPLVIYHHENKNKYTELIEILYSPEAFPANHKKKCFPPIMCNTV